MSNVFQDLTGQRFSRLVVVARAENTATGQARWTVVCDCGEQKIVEARNLRRGRTVSCGCVRTIHGECGSKLYRVWSDMIQRCTNQAHKSFPNYGGRGISVCERWFNFVNFKEDMGHAPEGLSIERIDNALGYSPSNCKWETQTAQARNTRRNHLLMHDGKTMSIAEWAESIGVEYNTLHQRISNGWTIERALTTRN